MTLPLYQCHKRVRAAKVKDCASSTVSPGAHCLRFDDAAIQPVIVEDWWVKKHQPQPGGYFVVYEDGYTSYSPAAAFEGGYTLLTTLQGA
jgi:hypothetical protein